MNLYTSHLQKVLAGQQKQTNISNYVKDLNVYDARNLKVLEKSKDKAIILAEKTNNVKLQKEIDHYEGVV
ncbi:MAG: hypothetical protein EOM68_28500, partial [Spirochaetia bacterium]|nr:hypothetical protein [Spirochaetia bacterium]